MLVAAAAAEGAGRFVSGRPTYGQDVRSLLRDGMVQKLRCAEDCLVSGHLVVSREDVTALEGRPRRSGELRAAKLADLRLEGGRWYLVRTPLGRRAATQLRRAGQPVRISATNLAVSLESGRHGLDGWSQSYGR